MEVAGIPQSDRQSHACHTRRDSQSSWPSCPARGTALWGRRSSRAACRRMMASDGHRRSQMRRRLRAWGRRRYRRFAIGSWISIMSHSLPKELNNVRRGRDRCSEGKCRSASRGRRIRGCAVTVSVSIALHGNMMPAHVKWRILISPFEELLADPVNVVSKILHCPSQVYQ